VIVSPHAQGSVDWAIARSGIPTASEFDNLVTPDFAIRKGEMPKTYLAKKLAEAWLGGPIASLNTFDMEMGKILEDEALPWFELESGLTVNRVGLITTDDGRIGCSPDGLLGDDSGIEIKCPATHTHIGYLLNGTLPKEYAAQVHGSMYVTGRKSWRFLSYCRRFPALLLTIERDEGIQGAIHTALIRFLEVFDDGMAALTKLNGGPPRRFKPNYPQPQQQYYVMRDEVVP
jgi:hypothetical protein